MHINKIEKCVLCGCDDLHACPEGCYWYGPDLCSACVRKTPVLCGKEPWASMIPLGLKTIETRTWETSYRGDILIASSKKPVFKDKFIAQCPNCFELAELQNFDAGGSDGIKLFCNECGQWVDTEPLDLSAGGIALCVVRLVNCRPMTKADEPAARCRIYPRAVSWVLKDVRPVKPFPVIGQLKLFKLNP